MPRFAASPKVIGGIVAFLTALQCSFAAPIEAETSQGTLLGDIKDGIAVFKGVPYAKPPLGEFRWRPPENAAPWLGTRSARDDGPACMQPETSEDAFYYALLPSMSEDCLYLNIWTPSLENGEIEQSAKWPVIVWIHGGSLISGHGASRLYDGVELAQKGVVIVTINYRLNIFGYFTHAELNEESPHGASGNYGTLDQIKALTWVRENIAGFGGDPANVTIFGESAGGLSVSHLMVSPLARGLFHKAIMQSAYLPPSRRMHAQRYGKLSGVEIGEAFEEEAGAGSLKDLRTLTADQILEAAIRYQFYPETVVDGFAFKEDIIESFFAGNQADTPLIAGFNSGEVYSFAGSGLIPPVPETSDAYINEVRSRYGDQTAEYLELYPPADLRAAVFDVTRDAIYGWAAEAFVRAMLEKQSSGYLYFFDHMAPEAVESGLYAFHASEIPYVFSNLDRNAMPPRWPTIEGSGTNAVMAETMSDYWVAFAKTGAPNPRERPAWLPYKDDERNYLHFNAGKAFVRKDLRPGMFEFHNDIVSVRKEGRALSWSFFEVGLFSPKIQEE